MKREDDHAVGDERLVFTDARSVNLHDALDVSLFECWLNDERVELVGMGVFDVIFKAVIGRLNPVPFLFN